MNQEQLRDSWYAEERYAFSGWDFSHIDDRYTEGELPWSYREAALDGLLPTHRILDMGTGGGEFLRTLGHPFEMTEVTEGYPPNIALCRERLEPQGVRVYGVDGEEKLPIADGRFDRVLNRHESFLPDECFRVLKPGGRFITQQVGELNDGGLRLRLNGSFQPKTPAHDLAHNAEILEKAGFAILRAEECFVPIRFFDVATLVYFAKILPWEFPGFTVDSHWDRLLAVHREIEEKGFVEAQEHRFLIAAEKH